MIGLDSLTPEFATDLIELVNSLQKLPKTCKVSYKVCNKKTGQWSKKEFSYVPLDNILEKIKENKNFSFMQPIGYDEKSQKFGVKCVLIHKSGKYLVSDSFEIKTDPNMKIQDEGAQITYRKRYAAGSFFGIATEEDTDGNDDYADQVVNPYDFEKMTEEQQSIIASLTPDLKDQLREFYKKDPMKLTYQEADTSIKSLRKKGLIKTKKEEEIETKEKAEVF